jgi:hypothetical protein
MTLYVAAIVGNAHLAVELQRLGLCAPDDALRDAERLRGMLLETVEAARADKDFEEVFTRSIARRVIRELHVVAGYPPNMPSVEQIADALSAAYNEHPVTMATDPAHDLVPEDVLEEARQIHETLLALLLIEGEPGEEHDDDADQR